jgi:hypothetical protein
MDSLMVIITPVLMGEVLETLLTTVQEVRLAVIEWYLGRLTITATAVATAIEKSSLI